MRPAIVFGFVAGLVLVAGAFTGLPQARANGVPQLVKLTYLQGVSNFGPQNAEGVLEFSFAEAFARVDVKNLPPADGYTYEGWLTGGGAAPFRVGEIQVDASGIGVLETKLAGLASYDYDLFVVAARSASTPDGAMPAERSIAGRFAVIADNTGSVPGDVRPGTLPETGEKPPLTTNERLGRVFMIAGPTAGLALILLSLNRRRSRR